MAGGGHALGVAGEGLEWQGVKKWPHGRHSPGNVTTGPPGVVVLVYHSVSVLEKHALARGRGENTIWTRATAAEEEL